MVGSPWSCPGKEDADFYADKLGTCTFRFRCLYLKFVFSSIKIPFGWGFKLWHFILFKIAFYCMFDSMMSLKLESDGLRWISAWF